MAAHRKGQGRAPLGALLGIHTRLYDEAVLLAAVPHESSTGPSVLARRQPLCQAHTKRMVIQVPL